MRRTTRLLVLLLASISILALVPSCQNIFGTATDISKVYGDWVYKKDGGFEIRLSLYRNGTYHYEEIASYGATLYEFSGKYSISSTSLTLKDLDPADGDRYSTFSMSMKNSTESEDILDLVPTLAKRYSFRRVGYEANEASIVSSSSNLERKTASDKQAIKLDIEGSWRSDVLGTVSISGDTIIFIPLSGDTIALKVASADGNTIKISDDAMILDEYKEITYFTVNDNLYVVFPRLGSDAIAFSALK